MASTDPRAPYFVMAHHRSGSNFLNDLLQSHPRVECINEPFSMHTRLFRDFDLLPWSGDDFDREQLHPSLATHPVLRCYLDEFRAYLSSSNGMRVIGFKDTVLFGKLEWLKAFLPSLKILFLKRDPRAIVSSVLRSNLSEFWRYAQLVPPAFQKIFPGYVSRTAPDDPATAAAELAAMSVVARYELARRTIHHFEHRELDLGELLRKPQDQLEAIVDFLGIDAHEAPLTFLKRRQLASRGGIFSSFRLQHDVEHGWERHLNAKQVLAIEDVLQCR